MVSILWLRPLGVSTPILTRDVLLLNNYRRMCHDFFVSREAAEYGQGDRLEHQLRASVRTVFAPKHSRKERISDALESDKEHFASLVSSKRLANLSFYYFVPLILDV